MAKFGKSEEKARHGDIVSIDLTMTPEDGFVPEMLFDTHGVQTFVLGWGNYLPGLHELVEGCQVGDSVEDISVDAGWGSRRQDLLFNVPMHKLEKIISGQKDFELRAGATLTLPGDIQVPVKEISDENSYVVLDANPPLAGTSYRCSFKVLDVIPISEELFEHHNIDGSRYETATFALGCFWGAELAFSRLSGVVGTQVGYSQGTVESPTYEQVCEGSTQHREVVRVVYDTWLISYEDLMSVAQDRLDQTTSSLELHKLYQTPADSRQYKHGFYFHTEAQHQAAADFLDHRGNRFGVELLQASEFYLAEDYHQHYLYKGGQSTRKGSKETIRCFG